MRKVKVYSGPPIPEQVGSVIKVIEINCMIAEIELREANLENG
jgi:hypothetical protein